MKLVIVFAAALTSLAITVATPTVAATVMTSGQFGPGPTDYNGTGSGAANLAYFNGALGTLTSVSLSVTYGFSSTVVVSNASQSSSTGTVRVESAAGFSSLDRNIDAVFDASINQLGYTAVGGAAIDPAAFDLFGTNRSYSLSAGQSNAFASNAPTQSFSSSGVTDAATLAAFTSANGGNFIAQLVTATGTLIGNTGGNTFASHNTTATGTLQVIYNYTPAAIAPAVPEPTTWAMMLVGFGMIGGAARYRRRSTTMTFA